ncbi:MAG: hypothetical protein ACR2H2_19020 [Solirubrobacteraceae bacterium]
MISWATILYGAAITAVLTAACLIFAIRERRAQVLSVAVAASAIGPIAWNAILRATGGAGFFTDAPIVVFPISWQDTGSGIFALALASLALGLGPLRDAPAQQTMTRAALVAAIALAVDIYLY